MVTRGRIRQLVIKLVLGGIGSLIAPTNEILALFKYETNVGFVDSLASVHSNDDSDSDDEYLKNKRKKGIHGVRGFSRSTKISQEAKDRPTVLSSIFSQPSHLYDLEPESMSLPPGVLQYDNNSDIEDDIANLAGRKTDKGRKSPVLVLSDSDEETGDCRTVGVHTPESSFTCTNTVASPSPPPPPAQLIVNRRRPRKTKQLKDTLRIIETTQNLLAGQRKKVADSPDVYVVEDDQLDEVTVRIDLKGKIHRYILKTHQMFSVVISEIALMENVEEKTIMLVHKDRTIRTHDTPKSLHLHTADIISCHIGANLNISYHDLNNSLGLDDLDLINLCCQSNTSKHKVTLKTHVLQPLSQLMKEYASRIKKDVFSLKFLFDGELLTGSETASSLDMEAEDCIDVIAS